MTVLSAGASGHPERTRRLRQDTARARAGGRPGGSHLRRGLVGRPGVAGRSAKGGSRGGRGARGASAAGADRAPGRLRLPRRPAGVGGPRQLRACAGGLRRDGRCAAEGCSRRSRLGHEPVTTGGGGRDRLAGTADVVAGIRGVQRGVGRFGRGGVVRRARGPGAPGFHSERRQRRVCCPRVRGRGRLAARHRARGGTAADAVGRADREQSGAALPAAQRRTPDRRTAPADASRIRAVESRTPVARRAGIAAPGVGVRGRVHVPDR